jgi:uncharacterized protein
MHAASFILVVVGALNWLLYGLFHWEIGSLVGGMDGVVARIIYIIVGLGGLYMLINHKKDCKMCMGMGGNNMPPKQGM